MVLLNLVGNIALKHDAKRSAAWGGNAVATLAVSANECTSSDSVFQLHLQSERRAERLSRARRPQFGGKRRRPPTRVSKQPKGNDYNSDEGRPGTPPHFDYVVSQKPEGKQRFVISLKVSVIGTKIFIRV